MLNSLKKIFDQKNISEQNKSSDNLQLLCGLMIEAANSDGKITSEELEKITTALAVIFQEDPEDINNSINIALENKNNSKSLHFFTSQINKEFSPKKKLLLIETLWEIIYSDGQVHEYESNLIRRLAGLLYISDVNAGAARKRVLEKLNK